MSNNNEIAQEIIKELSEILEEIYIDGEFYLGFYEDFKKNRQDL